MNITSLARKLFAPRWRELELHQTRGEELQREVLRHLLEKARDTSFGRNHLFGATHTYDDFVRHTPICSYEELKEDIDRMRQGEADLLWPGRVKWYAKSSGTTNDKSKFIPVSPDGLKRLHYKGGSDTVAIYLRNNPQSRMFDGRGLILGGSHAPNYNLPGSLVGDLSAILIENINPLVNLIRVPSKQTALLSDFELKRDRIAQEALTKNVTNISGVPSWMLSVLNRLMELSGKQHLEEVWPNIEVFFHGGVAFTPYREQYERLITSPRMHYMETYNASEGFFGIQDDPADKSMLLMLDYDVFYEFIPSEKLQVISDKSQVISDKSQVISDKSQVISDKSQVISDKCGYTSGMDTEGNHTYNLSLNTCNLSLNTCNLSLNTCNLSLNTCNLEAVPLWGVEPGRNYAMVISTSCGLWRYMIGDTIRFTSTNPYKFVISGRTKSFINAFGEELIVDNAEQGLAYACEKTGAQVQEYTAAPVFMDQNAKCRHQWLIEFSRPPADVQQFAGILDRRLQELNSDYEAKRYKDITLQPLEIIVAREGLFHEWLKSRGKLGGQHKVPRLSNSREHLDQLLEMNNKPAS